MPIEPVVQRREPLNREEIARYSRHLIIPDVGWRVRSGSRPPRSCSSAPAGSDRRWRCTSRPPASARSGWSTTTSSTPPTCSDRSSTAPRTSASTSSIPPRSHQGHQPHVEVIKHRTFLNSENALEIVAPYDLVIDGTDNFPTRYLVNDACVLLGKPNVYGSIFRFEGQLSVFYAKEGPCYRCMFPEPPPPGMVPNCAEGGVLGIMAGHIGTAQGIEGIKLIAGIGEPMIGRLGLYDALDQRWTYVKVNKDPSARSAETSRPSRNSSTTRSSAGCRPTTARRTTRPTSRSRSSRRSTPRSSTSPTSC
jgi:sulfur-carrier protein adenylyltransferase/sulfurtransferase